MSMTKKYHLYHNANHLQQSKTIHSQINWQKSFKILTNHIFQNRKLTQEMTHIKYLLTLNSQLPSTLNTLLKRLQGQLLNKNSGKEIFFLLQELMVSFFSWKTSSLFIAVRSLKFSRWEFTITWPLLISKPELPNVSQLILTILLLK